MKKLLSVLLIFATLCLILVGCKPSGNDDPQPGDEKKKYDASIKIVIEGVGEYIFTPDIEKMTVTIPYDGVSRRVYLAGYQYPDHPDKLHRETWLTPIYGIATRFETYMMMKDDKGWWTKEVEEIQEAGSYFFYFRADSTSTSWNFRILRLYINIEE